VNLVWEGNVALGVKLGDIWRQQRTAIDPPALEWTVERYMDDPAAHTITINGDILPILKMFSATIGEHGYLNYKMIFEGEFDYPAFSFARVENEKEREAREKKEQEAKDRILRTRARMREQNKMRKAKKEAAERETYERLKKKFDKA
jgi:hypothetical protein